MRAKGKEKGAVLVLVLILMVVVSAWAAGVSAMANSNLRIAENHRKANLALSAAESGLETARYYLGRIKMPSSTPPAQYFATIIADLNTDLSDVAKIVVDSNGSVPDVILDSATNQRFSVAMNMDDTYSNLTVSVTGKLGQDFARTVQTRFAVSAYEHPIFKYGMATKGPINFAGNPTTSVVNANWEADIYAECLGLNEFDVAIHLAGNTNFEGDIDIGGDAQFVYDNDLIIAGDAGQTAVDNHVEKNVGPMDFPAPDTARFVPYADSDPNAIIDSTTDLSHGMVLTNATIAANTNPVFQKGVTIQGVLIVEQPNIVTFSNVDVQGIIVGHGSVGDASTNQLNFNGNFSSGGYPAGADFDVMRDEIGTTILAPEFSASFTGNFASIAGVMATDGLNMNANASASLNGSILNYSEDASTVAGNVTLAFDRANSTKIPAGFDTHRVLTFDSSSYSVIF